MEETYDADFNINKYVWGMYGIYMYMYGICMDYVWNMLKKTTGIASTRYPWCTTRTPEENKTYAGIKDANTYIIMNMTCS